MKQMNAAQRQSHWDLRAAGNFIGGGTGCGLVLACALAAAFGAPLARPALAAGAICIALGLMLVWLEIGKPWRALNVFFHPQTSWMTREGILAGPLLASCALALWSGHAAWLAVAAPLAAGFLYAQARILRAARAIPAWSHRRVVPLIIVTGLTEGLGAWLVLAEATPLFIGAALLAALAREVAREAYRRGLVAVRAPQPTLAWFARPEVRALQLARLAANALLAAALIVPAWPVAATLGGALALLTGWGLKIVLVTRAAYTRGAAIPYTPTRGRSAGRAVMPR